VWAWINKPNGMALLSNHLNFFRIIDFIFNKTEPGAGLCGDAGRRETFETRELGCETNRRCHWFRWDRMA
jgi:hypothetical protein